MKYNGKQPGKGVMSFKANISTAVTHFSDYRKNLLRFVFSTLGFNDPGFFLELGFNKMRFTVKEDYLEQISGKH
ncbi:hypothetical protein V6N13_007615 [Hibiscus sabdariffa]